MHEAQLGDNTYELLWRQRMGFAKVAIEAQVPIIPIFTRNIREAFRSFNSVCPSFWRWLYSKTHLPFVPIYGGFPVKLTTYIGEPITFEPTITPEDLAKRVSQTVETMIDNYQPRPGNITRAIKERIFPQKSD